MVQCILHARLIFLAQKIQVEKILERPAVPGA